MATAKTPKFFADPTSAAPNTGEMLKRLFKKRRIYQSGLAHQLGRRPETVADYTRRASIQTTLLWEICHVLKHNFFVDMGAQLPADFATELPGDTAKDERIAQLERELEVVKAERDVLVRMGSGG